MFLDSSLIFEKVSMIANVASMACVLRSIVAIMYKPFSVRPDVPKLTLWAGAERSGLAVW